MWEPESVEDLYGVVTFGYDIAIAPMNYASYGFLHVSSLKSSQPTFQHDWGRD